MNPLEFNLLSNDNALAAVDFDTNHFLGLANNNSTWAATGGSADVTDISDHQYAPDYFSVVASPSSSTSTVLLYLNNIELPADLNDLYKLSFHAIFRCVQPITVTLKIGGQQFTIPKGNAGRVPAGAWTTVRSNVLDVGSSPAFSKVKIQAVIVGHQGNPVYMSVPVVMNENAFRDNNFVLNGKNYIPTYYWDIDAQQTYPSYPFYKMFDIYTREANNTTLQYADYFESDLDERSPGEIDSNLNKSTLTNPYFVDDDKRDWLAQFSGARIKSNVRALAKTYDTYERADSVHATQQLWAVRDEFAGLVAHSELTTANFADPELDWHKTFLSDATYTLSGEFDDATQTHRLYLRDPLAAASNGLIATRAGNLAIVDPVSGERFEFGCEVGVYDDAAPSFQLELIGYTQQHNKAAMRRVMSQTWNAVQFDTRQTGGGDLLVSRWANTYVDAENFYPEAIAGYYTGTTTANSGGWPSGANSVWYDIDGLGETIVLGDPTANLLTVAYDDGTNSWPTTTQAGISYYARMSLDGTVVAAASATDFEVWEFDSSTGTLTQRGSSITAAVHGLAVSSDGTTVGYIVGDGTNATAGAYDWDGTSWVQRPEVTFASTLNPGNVLNDTFQCEISGDGSMLVVSDYSNNFVTSYKYLDGAWTEFPLKWLLDQTGTEFGKSISLDSYGTSLVVGAPTATNSTYSDNAWGAVLVFKFVDNSLDSKNWVLAEKIENSGALANLTGTVVEGFGSHVHMSEGGAVIAVGTVAEISGVGVSDTVTELFRYDWTDDAYVLDTYNSTPSTYLTGNTYYANWAGQKIARFAAMPSGNDLRNRVLKDYFVGENTDGQTGLRALAVYFSQGEEASFSADLSNLNSLDYLLIEGSNGSVYRAQYSGNGYFHDSSVQYPTAYASNPLYLIPYYNRVEIVSGSSSGGYAATDEFITGAGTTPTALLDGEEGTKIHLLTSSTGSNFFTDEDADSYIDWQLQNLYYGFKAGSRESMVESARQTLTGNEKVAVPPNYEGIKFRIHLRTLTTETQNVDSVTTESHALLDAISPTLPSGFYFTHETVDKLFFTLDNVGIGRLDLNVLGN